MPSKDKKVISAKVSEKEFQMIETYANTHNISISAILSLCIKALIDGDIRIEKGELKTGVDPIGYAVFNTSEEEKYDYEYLKVDRLLSMLEEKGYPLREYIEGAINQLESLPKYKGKGRKSDDWC